MTRTLLAMLAACSLAACSGRMISDDDDAGGEPDAGPIPQLDAGPPDEDAGSDAGAIEEDAGPPPPACVCPEYPSACAAPAANEPTFTPESQEMIEQLLDVIACASDSLHIAMYEGDWPCVTAALQTALDNDPDLTIDIVTDDDRCPGGACIFDALDESDRVNVVRDARSNYMHHKWVIADGARVWLGSANFSERSFCEDHNNAIVVEDAAIVARYEAIFQRMFTDMTFGTVDPEEPTVSGAYSLYFSPESQTGTMPLRYYEDMLAEIELAASGDRIDVMMNAWTRIDVAAALIAAHGRGAQVQVLVSHVYANDPPAQEILEAGIPIRRSEIHDKAILIGDLVITGSANWSDNAFENNENILWIRDAAVAAAYRAEADRVFAEGRTVEPVGTP